MSESAWLDATAQAERVRTGEVKPAELVEEAIARIEELNPRLNAITIPTYEKARAEAAAADGPFRGVPYVLKDTMVSKGDLYTAGINGVKQARYLGNHDAYFVQRMRAAGFVLIGRTNVPELALVSTTESVAWGQCRNPWDTGLSTGGSSGGTAAAVSSGMVAVGHGSDGGGSVREPAAKCGVIGLKPTRGRLSQGPAVIDSDNAAGMSHEGLITRTVRDLAGLLDVTSGRRVGDPYGAPEPVRPFRDEVGRDPGRLRIGVLHDDPAGQFVVDAECVTAARRTAEVLAGLGHEVAASYPAAIRDDSWPVDFLPCVAIFALRELERFGALIGRPLTEDDVEPQTWAYAQMGSTVTGAQYAAGVDALRTRAHDTEQWWEEDGWDLLLTPTLTIRTPPLGQFNPTKEDPFGSLGMEPSRFTVPFNVSGQPSLSLPLHLDVDGLPIGVQLTAAYGREDVLIRVAAQLESAMPWADRRPAVGAR